MTGPRPFRRADARRRAVPRGDGGSVSLELVLVIPVLMLLALFVLWAGRGGRVSLITDLAAEEAATAAALTCDLEAGDDDTACEELVSDMLSARPGLDFLCIGGARLVDGEGLVETRYTPFSDSREAKGVSVTGVRFVCETDGAVAPLRGVFPTVSFRGQASEVAIQQGAPILEISDHTVTEGDDLVFVLSLDSPAVQDLVISYTITDGSTEPEDYDLPTPPHEVTIDVGATDATITVGTIDDGVYEGEETLDLTLTLPTLVDPPLVVFRNDDSTATGTIEDDESKPEFLLLKPRDQGLAGGKVVEGDSLDVTVRLGNFLGNEVHIEGEATIRLETVDGSATAPDDYTAILETLTFSAPDRLSHTVELSTADDTLAEALEDLELRLSGSTRFDVSSDSSPAPVEILDNEPMLSVTGECSVPDFNGPCANEGESLTFIVQLEGEATVAGGDVTVEYSVDPPEEWLPTPATSGPTCDTTDPAYTVGTDFVLPAPGTLTFAPGTYTPGTDTQEVTVESCADGVAEDLLEHLWLRVESSDNAHNDPDGGVMGAILNVDAPPMVSIGDADRVGEESDNPRLRFPLELITSNSDRTPKPSAKTVSVWYHTEDGTALAGEDYEAKPLWSPGWAVFAPGDTEAWAEVDIIDDDLVENNDETVVVRLQRAGGADLPPQQPGACRRNDPDDDCAIGGILDDDFYDDDDRPVVVIDDAAAVTEGEVAEFTVRLVDGDGDPVTELGADAWVRYRIVVDDDVDDHTASEDDFVGALRGVVRFPRDDVGTKTVTVQTRSDLNFEENTETFEVRLRDPHNLEIKVNHWSQCPVFDNIIDPDFFAKDNCARGSIKDDRATDSHALVSVSGGRALEGDPVVFEVTLTEAADPDAPERTETVTVDYATEAATDSGNPAEPEDFTHLDSRGEAPPLQFAPGETTHSVSVDTTDDDVREPNERFRLRIVDVTNALPINGSDTYAHGVIEDGDQCTDSGHEPRVSAANKRSSEGARRVEVVFRLQRPLCAAVGWKMTTRDVTATAGEDYEELDTTGTLNVGSRTVSRRVDIIDDDVEEGAETFQVVLSWDTDNSAPPGWARLEYVAEVTIVDDELPHLSISGGTADEGDDVEFEVQLTSKPGVQRTESVTVNFNTADHAESSSVKRATEGDDYTAVSTVVTFAPTEATKTISVETIKDADWFEREEFFRAVLSDPQNAVIGVSGAGASGQIEERCYDGGDVGAGDSSPLRMRDARVSETGEATRTASSADFRYAFGSVLCGETAQRLRFAIAHVSTDQHDISCTSTVTHWPTSNTGEPGSLRYLQRSFAVVVSDDSLVETDETFKVYTFWGPGEGLLCGQSPDDVLEQIRQIPREPGESRPHVLAEATGTIIDNDSECADPYSRNHEPVAAGIPIYPDLAELNEGGAAAVQVSLSLPLCEAIGVRLRVKEHPGKAPPDADARVGQSSDEMVDFEVGEVVVEVPAGSNRVDVGHLLAPMVVDDTVDEEAEHLYVDLSWVPPEGGELAPLYQDGWVAETRTVRLIDDDDQPTISVDNASALEGERVMHFTLRLDALSGKTVTVQYTVGALESADHPATPVDDFVLKTGEATFAPGLTETTVAVELEDNHLLEHDEQFKLGLYGANNAHLGNGAATGTILDDDGDCVVPYSDDHPPPQVTARLPLGIEAVLGLFEEHDGTMEILFELEFPLCAEARAAYGFDERTDAGGNAVATRCEDFVDPAWALSEDWASVCEGPEPAWSDLPMRGEITVPADTRLIWVPLTIVDDKLDEHVEVLHAWFDWLDGEGVPEDWKAPDPVAGWVRIRDNDLPSLFSGEDAAVIEGQRAALRVTLNKLSGRDVLVRYDPYAASGYRPGGRIQAATGGRRCAGGSGVDFEDGSRTMTIPAGQISHIALINTCPDTEAEEVESIRVALSSAVGDGTRTTSHWVTIVDDDSPLSRLQLLPVWADEGEPAVLTLRLSAPVGEQIVATYETFECSNAYPAEAGTDYTAVTGATVTIEPEMPAATFEVRTIQDTVTEPNEKFCVQIVSATVGGEDVDHSLMPGVANITIKDDECVTPTALVPGQEMPRIEITSVRPAMPWRTDTDYRGSNFNTAHNLYPGWLIREGVGRNRSNPAHFYAPGEFPQEYWLRVDTPLCEPARFWMNHSSGELDAFRGTEPRTADYNTPNTRTPITWTTTANPDGTPRTHKRQLLKIFNDSRAEDHWENIIMRVAWCLPYGVHDDCGMVRLRDMWPVIMRVVDDDSS